MSNTTESTPPAPLVTFGGFSVPAGCRRILITAELEPSNEGSLIQPTGFPDLGPVVYPDPAGKQGLICLIESEASMANRLEEVCFDIANKAEGKLRSELTNLPYIKLTKDGGSAGEFITSSTIDGHRFASEYIMGAHVAVGSEEHTAITEQLAANLAANEAAPPEQEQPSQATKKAPGKGAKKAAKKSSEPEFVAFVQHFMGMTGPDKCPAANVPRVFKLAMKYDPLSLVHGFQISVKKKLTFVGLRSPRALNASILGFGCERVTVPGIKFDPIGTGDAGQAIFQKPRITAKKIMARFSIDVGLISSFGITPDETKLIVKLCLCKVAWFLGAANSGIKLRTECDLRLKSNSAKFHIDRSDSAESEFVFTAIGTAAVSELAIPVDTTHSPLILKHVPKKKEEKDADDSASDNAAEAEGNETTDE